MYEKLGSTFLKLSILLATILSVSHLSVIAVQAKPVYQGRMSFDVRISDNKTEDGQTIVKVKQVIDVKNFRQDFLSSSLDYVAPFEIEGLRVELNGVPVAARIREKNVFIDFSNYLLSGKKPSKIVLYYDVVGVFNEWGELREVFWPQFEFGNSETTYTLNLSYPKEWGFVKYTNQQPEEVTESGIYRKLKFETNQPILFNLGQNGLIDLKLLPNKGDLREKGIFLLPKLFYETSVHNAFSGSNRAFVKSQDATKLEINSVFRELNLSLVATDALFEEGIGVKANKVEAGLFPLSSKANAKNIYNAVLEVYAPKRDIDGWSRKSITDIAKLPRQDDLDYAVTYASLLNWYGIPARVVYGLIHIPGTNEFSWHFWVVYQNGSGKWLQVDPYFEEAFGIDSFARLGKSRIAWGVLTKDLNLAQLQRDNFSLEVDNVIYKDFNSSTQRLGYLAGVESKLLLNIASESSEADVLGVSTMAGNQIVQLISNEQINFFARQVALFGFLSSLICINFLAFAYTKHPEVVTGYLRNWKSIFA